MINLILPDHLEPLLDHLRELYGWEMFVEEITDWAIILFKEAEFLKPEDNMDVELALLQWCACIKNMYGYEKAINLIKI